MKKHAGLLVAITLLFGLGVAAKAETRAEIVVTLPFAFVVGGKTLPAGTYSVSRWSGDKFGSLMLTSHDNRASVFLLPRNLLKNDSGYPMQPARTNQRRAKMACNAPIRPLYTFLVTFSESKVSA